MGKKEAQGAGDVVCCDICCMGYVLTVVQYDKDLSVQVPVKYAEHIAVGCASAAGTKGTGMHTRNKPVPTVREL